MGPDYSSSPDRPDPLPTGPVRDLASQPEMRPTPVRPTPVRRNPVRTVAAALLGPAVAAAAAVVLGDYPLSGAVPWVAAVVIPALTGAVMSLAGGRARPAFWLVTGPLAAGSMAWGVRIASGWGLDPVPAACWVAGAGALVWPSVVAALLRRRIRSKDLADGQLGDPGHVGRPQVGDP